MLRSISRRHSHAVGISGYLSGAEIATIRLQKGSTLEGTSLRDGILRNMSGATILKIKRGEELIPNPDPIWEMKGDDIVLLLGTSEQLATAGKLFKAHKANTVKNIGKDELSHLVVPDAERAAAAFGAGISELQGSKFYY